MKNSSDSLKTLIVTAGRSTERVVLLLSTILLSRYLTQQDYGTYRQTLLVAGFLVTILNFGIPNSINYFLPVYDKPQQKSFIIQTVLFQVFLGLIGSTVLYISAVPLSIQFNNVDLVSTLRIYSLYPLLFLPSMCYSNIFICINKTELAGLYSPIFGLIKIIFIAIAVLIKLPLISLLGVVLVANFLQLLIVLVSLHIIFYKIPFSLDFSNLLKQLRFALPMGVAAVVGLLIVKIDQFMISSMYSVEEYAIYSVGAVEVPFINMITVAGMAVITPYLVKSYKNSDMTGFMEKWRNSLLKLSYVIFPVAIFFVFFSTETITLIYGDRYLLSSEIFMIYQFKLLFKITFFGHILLSLGKSKKIMLYSLITLIVNVIMNFAFIHLFGYKGAALASVLSAFLISYLQLHEICRLTNINFSRIWPWKALSFILLVAVAAGYFSSYVRYISDRKIIVLISGMISFSFIYFIISQSVLRKMLPQNLQYKNLLRSVLNNGKE